MRTILSFTMILFAAVSALAEPTVVVFPFDPVMDSIYGNYGEKQSVLDYRGALQQMIATDLGKHEEIRVVELAALDSLVERFKISPQKWNDPRLASKIAAEVKADYVLIGTYGEYTKEIRVDARVVVAASGDVPPGNTVTATATLWEDLPTAATRIVEGVLPILTASGLARPTSKGVLFPEGELASYDPNGTAVSGTARLVIWINAPAPAITALPTADFARCERIDLMNVPKEKQQKNACRVAVLSAGSVKLRIAHRGYLPYEETLNLAEGKAYRLEVKLQTVEQLPR